MRVAPLLLAVALAGLAVPGGGAGTRRDLGPTAPSTRISFALSLRLDRGLLERDLAAGRPPLPTAAALGRRYGLPLADIRRVTRVLRAHGIDVTQTYPQRTALDATATVRTLSRFFHVGYRDRVDSSGVVYHAPASMPVLPGALRPYVTGVIGLATRRVALPADLPHAALRPDDALAAYDVAPLRQQGIDGSGTAIAILSHEPFPPSVSSSRDDLSTFRKQFKANGPSPVAIRLDGGGSVHDTGEDNLDLDVVSALAPGAQILNYEAPTTARGELDLFSRVVSDGRVGIVSFSWGICDKGLPGSFRAAVRTTLQLAVRRGITVFVASGDSGSYDCQRADFTDHSLTVDFPSDLPEVVAVGGTLLSVATDGSYFSEAGWEDTLSNAGGGGGVNTHDPAPSWQRTAGIGGGHRAVPDVAAAASPSSGWLVRDGGDWGAVGGTSAAAPFWASAMLLAEQYAARHGVSKRCFLAPILYRLATTPQAYPAFHDVVLGGNRYYDAARGFDYATGLGSPDVYNLARDLTAYLRTHPCGPGD